MPKNRIFIFDGCDRTGKTTYVGAFLEALREKGLLPVKFHLLGPMKFGGLRFNDDENSLSQLAKFSDEYDLFRQLLEQVPNSAVVLDRSAFSEFVWAVYWRRQGKYTPTVNSDEFFEKHSDLMAQTCYVNYYMSDIPALATRIRKSPEDNRIYTWNGKSVEENISDVYALFDILERGVVIPRVNKYIKLDCSSIGGVDVVRRYAKEHLQDFIGE